MAEPEQPQTPEPTQLPSDAIALPGCGLWEIRRYLDNGEHLSNLITSQSYWTPEGCAYAILKGSGGNQLAYIDGAGYVTLTRLAAHLGVDLDD